MYVLQVNQLNSFCCFIQRCSFAFQERCFTQSTIGRKNQTVNCLMYAENTRQPFNDNLFFCPPRVHLPRYQRLEGKTSKSFISFIITTEELSRNDFKEVHMNKILVLEDILTLNNGPYDIIFVDWSVLKVFVRRIEPKYKNTVKLLRYNNNTCYVSNINTVFQLFRCGNSDIFFRKKTQFWAICNNMQ